MIKRLQGLLAVAIIGRLPLFQGCQIWQFQILLAILHLELIILLLQKLWLHNLVRVARIINREALSVAAGADHRMQA